VTNLTAVAAVTKTLGHAGRLRILAMLRTGPLSVCQIATVLNSPVSTTSGHLVELRRAGLVCEQRRGKWVYYRLTDIEALATVLAPLLAAIADDQKVRGDVANVATLRGASRARVCHAAAGPAEEMLP
jgi:ArsR family transcriptional regulator